MKNETTYANFMTKANKQLFQDQNKIWTKNEMTVLYNLRTSGIPYNMIAFKLGRTVEGCRKKFANTEWDKVFKEKDPLEDLTQEEKQSFFQDKLELADKHQHIKHIATDVLSDCFAKSIKSLPEIKLEKANLSKIKTKHKEEDVMLMLSDIHIGAEYSLEETGGISEFNIETLNERFKNLKYAVKDIYQLHSNLYKLPTLHIACLGDVVAGDNSSGEWSANYIGTPIVEQILLGYSKISEVISYWLTFFEKIVFYGVRGNHGRVGKKGVEKDYSNFDYLCYRFLEESFKNNNRISFVIPRTWWILSEIMDHKFLMVHGDDIKGGGMPVKQLYDFESKMAGILKETPDYTIAGHFHSSAELSTNRGAVMINGSFLGGDMYSLKTIHSSTKAQQVIFGINKSRGKTWKYNIDLDDVRS